MVRPSDLVVSFGDLDRDDRHHIGDHASHIGDLASADFPVLPGFVVTPAAFYAFIKNNHLDTKIRHLLAALNHEHEGSLSQVSTLIKKMIMSSRIPQGVIDAVLNLYSEMDYPHVTLHGSIVEDGLEQLTGKSELRGEAVLLDNMRAIWASLFSPANIVARIKRGKDHLDSKITLVIQKSITPDSMGKIYTINPATYDNTKIVIEHQDGHWEQLHKKNAKSKNLEGPRVFVKDGVPQEEALDSQAEAFLDLAEKLERHHYFPQEIDWVMNAGNLFVIGTRPLTTINISEDAKLRRNPLLKGTPGASGIGVGHVRRIKNAMELSKVKNGEIIIVSSTDPSVFPHIKKLSGIITHENEKTAHTFVISRNFGIPVVSITENEANILKDGEVISVNGTTGEIFRGGFLTSAFNLN